MVMDYKLFIDLLMLLIHNNNDDTLILIEEVIGIFHDNRFSIRDDTAILFLISFIDEIKTMKLNYFKNKADILALYQKRKSNAILKLNPDLKESLENILNNEISPNIIINSTERINNYIIWIKSNKAVSQVYANLKEANNTENVLTQKNHLANVLNIINDLKEKLKVVDSQKAKFVERINFDNIKDIKTSFRKWKKRKKDFIFKTGLQGLNLMLGENRGISLGESIVFCGLPHNFKSGILMSMAKWFVHYNILPKDKDGKKPLILFISLENEAFENMIWWFQKLYQVITGEPPSEDLSEDEIVNFIYKYFDDKDYTFVIERYLPESFGYEDYVTLIEKYEELGYRVASTIIDYLQCMNLNPSSTFTSGAGTQNHLLIRSLFNKMCNYTKSKGISLISAHQLNRDAGKLVATGVPYPVKRFNGIHLAYSSDVEREPDVIIYIHIEKNREGKSFLTFNLTKHRYVDNTPDKDKFCAYAFNEYGIPDDLLLEKSNALKDIYNNKKKDKDEEGKEEAERLLNGF